MAKPTLLIRSAYLQRISKTEIALCLIIHCHREHDAMTDAILSEIKAYIALSDIPDFFNAFMICDDLREIENKSIKGTFQDNKLTSFSAFINGDLSITVQNTDEKIIQ